jgi:hypothetical protein
MPWVIVVVIVAMCGSWRRYIAAAGACQPMSLSAAISNVSSCFNGMPTHHTLAQVVARCRGRLSDAINFNFRKP